MRIEVIVTEFNADLQRIYLAGLSLGGYGSWYLAAKFPKKLRVAPGDFEKAGAEVRQMLLANVHAFQLDYNSRRPPFTCEDAGRVGMPAPVVSGGRSPMGLPRIAETSARCTKSCLPTLLVAEVKQPATHCP